MSVDTNTALRWKTFRASSMCNDGTMTGTVDIEEAEERVKHLNNAYVLLEQALLKKKDEIAMWQHCFYQCPRAAICGFEGNDRTRCEYRPKKRRHS